MKKLFILLSMAIVLSTTAFADASDFSISLGVPLQRIDSTVDGVRSIKSETDLTPFMISNYNVFGEKLCFGFFESMSVYTNEYMSLDFLVGPAIGANLSENFTVLAGLGLHIATSSSSKSNEVVVDGVKEYIDEDINNFFLGFGLDLRFKFVAHRRCTPVLGIRFNFDPYCAKSSIDANGKESVTDYDKYFKFSFVPSFGFCMNF